MFLDKIYHTVTPPSTKRLWTVTKFDASEARNTTAPSKSSGNPIDFLPSAVISPLTTLALTWLISATTIFAPA